MTTRGLLSAILAAVLIRAGASGAAPAGAPPPAAPPKEPRVILVGWDGADWHLLDALVKEGRLPNLAALLSRGRSWNLKSYQPMASPLIWTTIATGRSPVDHGVADFQELDPKTRDRLPISGRSRKVPAIWNLASAKGVSVGVVGWWASWPAERVNGFLVSDRAAPVLFDPESTSRAPAIAWPESLADGVRILVKREASPPFPDVAKALSITRAEFDAAVAAKKELADPITGFRRILGATRVIGKTALDLYDRETKKPRLLMVYFEGTDEVGHVLGRFYPPRLPSIREEDFRKYSGGVSALYAEADRILGELAARADRDGATLLLVSDHGFKWGEDRPVFYSGTQFDTAYHWHESPGILAAAGPSVAPSAKRGEASVFDIAPTLCLLLGLPPDPAFEGKPVPSLSGPAPAAPVSWAKTAPVERLQVAAGSAEERKAADEFTKKLISLGYLSGSEASAVDARPPDRAGTETASSFVNIGTFLRYTKGAGASVEWYRKALQVNPKSAGAWLSLSISLQALDQYAESDDALLSALANGQNDPEVAVYRRVKTYVDRTEKQSGEKQARGRAQLVAFLRKVVAAYPASERYRASLGKALFETQDPRNCAEAEPLFRDLLGRHPQDVESLNLAGLTALCQGKAEDARGFFKRSLAVKPDQEAVRQGLLELDRK